MGFLYWSGKGEIFSMPNLPDSEANRRKRVSQYSYTILESFICIYEICRTDHFIEKSDQGTYLRTLNDLVAFQAHIGRMRDNIKHLLSSFFEKPETSEKYSRFQDFYKKRNHVLHGKKLPMRILESMVLVPKIEGKSIEPSAWNSNLTWEDYREEDFVFVDEFLQSTLNELMTIVNDIYGSLYDKVKSITKSDVNFIPLEEYEDEQLGSIDASGTV